MPLEERASLEWSQGVTLDLHKLFLGQRLGGGLSREVFEFAYDPRYVVKIETQYFQNVTEMQVWGAVKDTEWAKWFAPVKSISGFGSVLIMRRTSEPTPRQKVNFPDKLPDFLADSRVENWGILNGRWVMHDYGFMRFITNGLKRAKMVHGDKVASSFSPPKVTA